uniref:glucosamine-6-phosphate deaminase n=1 Tax=Spironucleus salmonicida TaxID=348837 RepID=V6LVD1_9EUKA|eukprot:EST48183.1 Glucosamine-6-phosphate deaminase [Spironucleus salmonicida]
MPSKLIKSSTPAIDVANEIASIVRQNPVCILGLATGSTPIPVYNELIRLHKEEKLDFSQVKTINLDEYYGISGSHHQSYKYFMYENLFKHINIKPENTNFLNGEVKQEDIQQECDRYESLVQQSPPDIWLLGIGHNGHIAFNEPGSDGTSKTRLVQLSESTIKANARFFQEGEHIPNSSLTVGISTILKAKNTYFLQLEPQNLTPSIRHLAPFQAIALLLPERDRLPLLR